MRKGVTASGMPFAGPHKRGTLARCSGHSPEGSCFALPEPAPGPHMCGAPAEPDMARPGRGSAPSPPPLSICCAQPAASYGRVTYVCGARARAGMARRGRQGEAWCPPPAAKYPLGSVIRPQRPRVSGFRPVTSNGVALPLLHYTPMRWDVILPGSQRPCSQLRPCSYFPLHPQGDSTRVRSFGPPVVHMLCSLPKPTS